MAPDDPPVLHHVNGEPVPDLTAIPRDRWLAVLEPLGEDARRQALNATGLTIFDDFVADLNYQLLMRTPRRARAVRAAANTALRMGRDEYQELCDAADEVQLRPTQLARMLVRSGVRRIAYEARTREGS